MSNQIMSDLILFFVQTPGNTDQGAASLPSLDSSTTQTGDKLSVNIVTPGEARFYLMTSRTKRFILTD